MAEVLCDYRNCVNQTGEQRCGAAQIGLVDGMCITRRKVKRAENYRELMKAPFNANYDKNSAGGGYKSSRVKGVLK